jgi:hypothetical protein
MTMKTSSDLTLSALAVAAAIIFAGPTQALTMKECSAKYKEAQKAGMLKGMKWNDFRKAECGSDAKPAAASKSAPAAATTEEKKPATAAAAKTAMTPSKAVFPTAVSPKYSKESAGKARMHTCLDQYNANKATNANGGMKWIEKGGGYYSACNKRLKG